MADGSNAIGVHFAALLDRDIFAHHEVFVGEVKADVIGQGVAGWPGRNRAIRQASRCARQRLGSIRPSASSGATMA
jgi:hypothetical protein